MSVQAERAKEKSESCVGPGRGLPQGGARGVGAGGGGGGVGRDTDSKILLVRPPAAVSPRFSQGGGIGTHLREKGSRGRTWGPKVWT